MLQLEPLERRAVVGERHLVLGATIEEFEHAFRKSLFRDLAQVEDVVAVVQAAHLRFSFSPNDDSGIPCVNTEHILSARDIRGAVRVVTCWLAAVLEQIWPRLGIGPRWTNYRPERDDT